VVTRAREDMKYCS